MPRCSWLLLLLLLAGCRSAPQGAAVPARFRGSRIYSYRSPGGGTEAAVIRQIDAARKRVLVAMYYLTDQNLAGALSRARARGVDVQVVVDKTQPRARSSRIGELTRAGVLVYVDREHRIMHDKFCVVDGSTVITGSQNWTASSEKENAENTLIVKENAHLAEKYEQWFSDLRDRAEPYAAEEEEAPSSSGGG